VIRVPVTSDNYNGLSATKTGLVYTVGGAGYYGRDSDRERSLRASFVRVQGRKRLTYAQCFLLILQRALHVAHLHQQTADVRIRAREIVAVQKIRRLGFSQLLTNGQLLANHRQLACRITLRAKQSRDVPVTIEKLTTIVAIGRIRRD